MRAPTKYCEIGDIVSYGGKNYIVVERGYVSAPKYVCKGCDVDQQSCNFLKCSAVDREDGKNVWFVRIK